VAVAVAVKEGAACSSSSSNRSRSWWEMEGFYRYLSRFLLEKVEERC
jgi:hypothetical protein